MFLLFTWLPQHCIFTVILICFIPFSRNIFMSTMWNQHVTSLLWTLLKYVIHAHKMCDRGHFPSLYVLTLCFLWGSCSFHWIVNDWLQHCNHSYLSKLRPFWTFKYLSNTLVLRSPSCCWIRTTGSTSSMPSGQTFPLPPSRGLWVTWTLPAAALSSALSPN